MISGRVQEIKPFIVMDVLEKAQAMERAGTSIIHLEVGEPDFDTPNCIRDAAHRALDRGDTHYTHSLGIPELRQAIAHHYQTSYGLAPINPERVIVTMGSSPAILVALAAVLENGDEVVLSDPHYACYPNFIRFCGGIPRTIPVFEDDGFQYRPGDIRKQATSRTKAIFINSPANPTGNLLDADRMQAIADLGRLVLSDEIYHGLVYEGQAHSILEFTDRCIVFNGFSKLYAMTGLRLGYLIVPEELVRPIQKIVQNFFISANSVVQWAGHAALTDPGLTEEIRRMLDTYDTRRRVMIRRLREIGFGISVDPTGAFYVFANAARFTRDSYAFAFEVLEHAQVGITPGVDFGAHGEGYIRFSYANSLDNITEGLARLERYLAGRSGS
jgi:(5-formylfuran-3-yl)methyl phosphate transaminase